MNDYQTVVELEPIDGEAMSKEADEPVMIVNGKNLFSAINFCT